MLEWQREASDPSEFLDALRFDLSSQNVYVFTPKGDVVALPTCSTPVNFAYAVHTEVGHRCIGARVNGESVPMESTLSGGRCDRDLHVGVGDGRPVAELARVRQEPTGPSEDPQVRQQGSARTED